MLYRSPIDASLTGTTGLHLPSSGVQANEKMQIRGYRLESDPTRASKPEITSKSSSSIRSWRTRWNLLCRFANSSWIFLSARCIAERRLKFSLARDSAHARKSEMKRYSWMRARSVEEPSQRTSGRLLVEASESWIVLLAIARLTAVTAHRPARRATRTWGRYGRQKPVRTYPSLAAPRFQFGSSRQAKR